MIYHIHIHDGLDVPCALTNGYKHQTEASKALKDYIAG